MVVWSTSAAVHQHEFEIAIADREHQIPPHRPQDHLGGELPAFEGLILPDPRRLSLSRHASGLPDPIRHHKLATEPVARKSLQSLPSSFVNTHHGAVKGIAQPRLTGCETEGQAADDAGAYPGLAFWSRSCVNSGYDPTPGSDCNSPQG